MVYSVVLLYQVARVNNSSSMATANENVQFDDTPLSSVGGAVSAFNLLKD